MSLCINTGENTNNRVAIIYNDVKETDTPDELDVLSEVKLVRETLDSLGYETREIPVTLDLRSALGRIKSIDPLLVFNLVESIEGKDSLIHLMPSVLEAERVPYTGCTAESIWLTTNKVTAKNIYSIMGIRTPQWFLPGPGQTSGRRFAPPYIIKSIWGHASANMSDESVLYDNKGIEKAAGGDFFIEAYVDGREFNLAILASGKGPEVLPPQEIVFSDYMPGKPKIVGYDAKWKEESFEYKHTDRTFDFPDADEDLIEKMRSISFRCWRSLGLRGYARCDFRVDASGDPWLLEVNTNPCISPDSGFIAAATRAGLNANDVIQRIVEDSLHGPGRPVDFAYKEIE